MNIRITNSNIGYGRLTTEHAASSYNVPVLVIDSEVGAYDAAEGPFGPADAVSFPDELAWMWDGIKTYADAVCAGMKHAEPSADQIAAINQWMAPIGRHYA